MPARASGGPLGGVVEPRTERLWLRRWRAADRAPFAALNADPEVMRHFQSTLDERAADAFVARHAARLEAQGFGLWAVEVVATGHFIGFVGLNEPTFEADFTPCTEIGWRLARTAWGHGYATEAARAALAVAFGPVGLDEVVSFTTVGNTRSRAVMERLGMTHTEDFDHPRIPEGHPMRRHVLYRLPATASR